MDKGLSLVGYVYKKEVITLIRDPSFITLYKVSRGGTDELYRELVSTGVEITSRDLHATLGGWGLRLTDEETDYLFNTPQIWGLFPYTSIKLPNIFARGGSGYYFNCINKAIKELNAGRVRPDQFDSSMEWLITGIIYISRAETDSGVQMTEQFEEIGKGLADRLREDCYKMDEWDRNINIGKLKRLMGRLREGKGAYREQIQVLGNSLLQYLQEETELPSCNIREEKYNVFRIENTRRK